MNSSRIALVALLAFTSRLFGSVFVGDLQFSSSLITGASTVPAVGGLIAGGGALAADPAWKDKIVVADRGGSTFLEKAEAVKQSGGVGLIIVNTSNGSFNATLGTGITSTLAAVTMTLDDGNRLKQQIGQQGAISPTKPDPFALRALANTVAIMERLTVIETKISLTPPTTPIIELGPNDARAGTEVTLIATADGSPAPTWTWKKNGTIIEGQTSAALVLHAVTTNDNGSYTAVATNSEGAAEATEVLNVVP